MFVGANVNATDEQNMTAFLWAVWKGKTLFFMYKYKSTVRHEIKSVIIICISGHIQCVQTLIGRSNVHHYDVHGRNALHLAAITGDLQVSDLD